ncbi:MAG: hypothetical protein P9M03_02035 [Candidatus Theseobacter exili]|nr:hypothetical protein [Candidatus Theseobacter exili]
MYYLVINVFIEKHAEEVLIALTEAGVKDVVSWTGVNESRRLGYNFPIFAGFREELGKSTINCKVICAVIKEKEKIKRMLRQLKHSGLDFLGDQIGSILLIPIEEGMGIE